MTSPKDIALAWARAFDAHDLSALAELYAEDAIEFQIPLSPVRGRAAIVAGIAGFFAAFPDSYTEIVNVLGDGEWAALEWRGGGTHLGDFAGVAATGRTFELRGCGFFRIPAAAVVCQRGYWDKVAWFGQLGLPLD